MKRTRGTRCTAFLLLAAAAAVSTGCSAITSDGGADGADTIVVGHAWAEPQNDSDAVVFGMVMNVTSSAATVVSATSDAAGRVELHKTSHSADGSVSTEEIPGGFRLPAGQHILLEPGGNHLVLVQLVEPLLPGNEITVTLTLEDGSESRFVAPVKDATDGKETDGVEE